MKNSNKNSFLSGIRSLFYNNARAEHTDNSTMTMVEDFTFDCVYRTTSNDDYDQRIRRNKSCESKSNSIMRLISISSSESMTSLSSQDDVCCICLEDIKKSKLLTMTGCQHKFHIKCVKEWLEQRPTCPLCNSDQQKLYERLNR